MHADQFHRPSNCGGIVLMRLQFPYGQFSHIQFRTFLKGKQHASLCPDSKLHTYRCFRRKWCCRSAVPAESMVFSFSVFFVLGHKIKFFPGLPGLSLCLLIWVMRKRIYVLLYVHLVSYLVLTKLILNILFYLLFISPCRIHIVTSRPKCYCHTYTLSLHGNRISSGRFSLWDIPLQRNP